MQDNFSDHLAIRNCWDVLSPYDPFKTITVVSCYFDLEERVEFYMALNFMIIYDIGCLSISWVKCNHFARHMDCICRHKQL